MNSVPTVSLCSPTTNCFAKYIARSARPDLQPAGAPRAWSYQVSASSPCTVSSANHSIAKMLLENSMPAGSTTGTCSHPHVSVCY